MGYGNFRNTDLSVGEGGGGGEGEGEGGMISVHYE